MKQNPCPVVGEVTKPTGVGLELDGAVEGFSTRIADVVLAEVGQPRLMTSQYLDDLDGLQHSDRSCQRNGIKYLQDADLSRYNRGSSAVYTCRLSGQSER